MKTKMLFLFIFLINISIITGCGDGTAFDISKNNQSFVWNYTTPLTPARGGHAAAVINGYLYVIGGLSGPASPLNDVQFARINDDGTIGSWTASTSFATPRGGHSSNSYNGFIYVIGGLLTSNLNDVQYAHVNADGTIGVWTATTSFTTGRHGHTSVVNNGYVYVIGGIGDGDTYLNDVQFAKINPDGTIGAWSATTPFNTGRYGHRSAVYNGYIYVISGKVGPTSVIDDIQYAHINADGTVGVWGSTVAIGSGRGGHSTAIYNGSLYVLGGLYSLYYNDVRSASINPDGTIGPAWAVRNSFTTARYIHKSPVYNGYLYVIGGYNGSYLNDVQYARIGD